MSSFPNTALRYQVRRRIGQGGMGEVYEAWDQAEKKTVALKFLSDLPQEKMFRDEARLLTQLSHPNLISFYDFQNEGRSHVAFAKEIPDADALRLAGSPFFAMEWLEDPSLEDDGRRLSFEEWLNFLVQSAQGLNYLHRRRVLHGDLKPANIVFTRNHEVKILDFGLAPLRSAPQGGAAMGSPAYLPPEAFVGDYDESTDLYSLGVSLYEKLSGSLPPPSAGEVDPGANSLAALRPDLPKYFVDLVHRLIAREPARRPRTALSLLRYLNGHLERPVPIQETEDLETILKKPPFVPRAAEDKIFRESYAAAVGGQGPVLLGVTGPTGVGRSRLVQEWIWELRLSGIPARLISDREENSWWVGEAGETGAQALRRLAQAPSVGPDVWAFTDLHNWSEAARQRLQLFLAFGRQAGRPRLILLEWNGDLAGENLLAWLEERAQESPVTILKLQDWSLEDTRLLIRGAAAEFKLAEPQIAALAEASGGRPLLALEHLRRILQSPDKNLSDSLADLPRNLETALRRQIKGLGKAAQQLLALVVTQEESGSEDRLKELGGFSPESWQEAREELENKSLLSSSRRSGGLLNLAHPSLRATLRESLAPALIEDARRQGLQELLARHPDAKPHPELLPLWNYADALDERAVLKKYGIAAAMQWQAKGEERRAVAVYERLLPLAADAKERVLLEAHAAPAYYNLAEYEKSLGAYDRWFAEREDDATFLQKLKHRFYTGLVYHGSGDWKRAEARLQEALDIGQGGKHPAHRPYLVRVHNLLAAQAEREGDETQTGSHLEAAKGLAEGDALSLGDIEQRLGQWHFQREEWRAAAAAFENSARHYAAAGHAQGEAIPQNALAMLRLAQGRLGEAYAAEQRALELAGRDQNALQEARYRENLALILLDAGRYAAAGEPFEETETWFQVLGQESDRLRMKLNRARFHLALGRNEVAARLLTAAFSGQKEEIGLEAESRLAAADLAYARGDWPAAGRLFAAAGKTEARPGAYERLLAQWGEARCRIRLGQAPGAGMQIPESLDSPWWQLAGRILDFARSQGSELTEAEFVALLEAAENLENPDLASECFALLTAVVEAQGLADLAAVLANAARLQRQKIEQHLPEEMKMDYEKKGGLPSLDQKISQWLPPKPVAATPTADPAAGQVITEARFRQFSEINRQIAEKTDLNEILERVMDAAVEFTGAERGFLLWKSDAKETLLPGFEVKTARHLSQVTLKAEEFKISRTVLDQALQTGSYLLIENAQRDARLQEKKSVVLYQLLSILVVPMQLSGKVLGMIYLDHRYQPGTFTTEHVLLLHAFASQAALAIQKAQMLAEISKAKDKLEIEVRDQALHIENLTGELAKARSMLRYEYNEIVGQSPAMMRVFQLLDHVTETAIPVWIRGESGTGKELIARSLHFNSPRKSAAFIAENCSAIPENLLESELFGHKKGAFTHADRDRIGLFEQANGGTLFLDEIADMSLGMQAKLLRVLQEGEVRPVGSSKKIKVDVRLVTASNRDLNQMVKDEKFRQDLFFRLNGLTIQLPPLRARAEDIPILVEHIVKRFSKEFGLASGGVSDEAFEVLMEYPWPGNIRELEAVMRNALLFAKGRPITPEYLTLNPILSGSEEAVLHTGSLTKQKISQSGDKEKKKLVDLLRRYRLDKGKVAASLGISLRNLYTRLERLGLPKKKSQLARMLQM